MSLATKDMQLISQVKAIWPDYKISTHDLQQPATSLVVNFVKRAVMELGLDTRSFENKMDSINDAMLCTIMIRHCLKLYGHDMNVTIDSILEPKRKSILGIFGYLVFFILMNKEKQVEHEMHEKKANDLLQTINELRSKRDLLLEQKNEQKKFKKDLEKTGQDMAARKIKIGHELNAVKDEREHFIQLQNKSDEALRYESEYNVQLVKERNQLLEKIQSKVDDMVDEKFYKITEKNRDNEQENIKVVDKQLEEAISNLENKRSIVKYYNENTETFKRFLADYNEFAEKKLKNTESANATDAEDEKCIADLKDVYRTVSQKAETSISRLAELQTKLDDKRAENEQKKSVLLKKLSCVSQTSETTHREIKQTCSAIIEKISHFRLRNPYGDLMKYSDDDLNRILRPILENNSDFDNIANSPFVKNIFQIAENFFTHINDDISSEKREIQCTHRQVEITKFIICKKFQQSFETLYDILNKTKQFTRPN